MEDKKDFVDLKVDYYTLTSVKDNLEQQIEGLRDILKYLGKPETERMDKIEEQVVNNGVRIEVIRGEAETRNRTTRCIVEAFRQKQKERIEDVRNNIVLINNDIDNLNEKIKFLKYYNLALAFFSLSIFLLK